MFFYILLIKISDMRYFKLESREVFIIVNEVMITIGREERIVSK